MENNPIEPENTTSPETPAENAASNSENTENQLVNQTEQEIAPVVEPQIVHEPESVSEEAPVQLEQEDESLQLAAIVPQQEEEIEAEPEEDFGQLSKEELVVKMEAFSKESDVNAVKNRVQHAKDAFQSIFIPERDQAMAAFIENGGLKEDFEYKDLLEERFFNAYKYFQKRRSEFILGQEKLRTENLRLKTEILKQMKDILQKEEDMSRAFNEFHELQAKWRSIGPVPPQNMNDLWMTFRLYSDRFYEFIRLNRELQDLEMKKNLEMKLHLCEKAEELLLEPSLNKALQEMQALQLKWREIGSVAREKRTEIWLRFKAAVDKVYDNKRSYLDSQRKVFEDNLNAKTALLKRAMEIVGAAYARHQEWQDGLKNLMDLQAEWRKIGPAGKEHNDSIWSQFKSTCDQFFKNKDAFYKQKKQEYSTNLQAKTELCVQAESLIESTDWKSTTNEFIRLQQEWKKIGPAGEKNEKVWQRFKKACDAWFERKGAHFSDQDQAQSVNLEQKNALVAEVEQYTLHEDPNEALEQLKAFQRRFTEIGLVPMKQKDDIQQRFRAAVQKHFDSLKANPAYRQSYREKQERSGERPPLRHDRSERPARTSAVEAGGSDEQRNLMNKVSKLSGEVQLWENNLGFFANSKNASALKQEYEAKIQQAKDEIQKLRDRLKELKNTP